jgi:hypothetical protein
VAAPAFLLDGHLRKKWKFPAFAWHQTCNRSHGEDIATGLNLFEPNHAENVFCWHVALVVTFL